MIKGILIPVVVSILILGSLGLSEDAWAGAGPVLVQDEFGVFHEVELSQFEFASADACLSTHFHAGPPGFVSVTALDGTVIFDPDPFVCGYGISADDLSGTLTNPRDAAIVPSFFRFTMDVTNGIIVGTESMQVPFFDALAFHTPTTDPAPPPLTDARALALQVVAEENPDESIDFNLLIFPGSDNGRLNTNALNPDGALFVEMDLPFGQDGTVIDFLLELEADGEFHSFDQTKLPDLVIIDGTALDPVKINLDFPFSLLPDPLGDIGSIDLSFVITPTGEDPTGNTGQVSFDLDTYKVKDTVTITLEDPDLNLDPDLIEIYQVNPDTDQVEADDDGELARLLDITFDDEPWRAGCNPPLEGFGATEFTLEETDPDSGVFLGDFQIPDLYCSGVEPAPVAGTDMKVNYVDFRDASGETIEVGDGAGIRANTGSVSLDRVEYPVPFGTPDDFSTNISETPAGRSLFPIHSTGLGGEGAGLDDTEVLGLGDLTVHIRVNDPDEDLDPIGEDSLDTDAAGFGFARGPVKISVIRGSDTVILGYAGGPAVADGLIHIGTADVAGVQQFGPILETAPDTGIFELDLAIRYTDGPSDTQCPPTTTFTPLFGGGTDESSRFDTPSPPGADYCILTGDLLVVEYTDPAGDDGNPVTVTESVPFSLRDGILQTDKGVYIFGDEMILTLIEPDLNLENEEAEIFDLDLIEWDSDAATLTMGDLGGNNFDPTPLDLTETGDNTGIFQVVIPIPNQVNGNVLEDGDEIVLEYQDWGPEAGNHVGSDLLPSSIVITIGDQTPPEIETHADITEEASTNEGEFIVFIDPPATDNVDPNPTVECDPPSGSLFPVGDTLITCTATDSSGNQSQSTFTITILAPIPAPVVTSPSSGDEVSNPLTVEGTIVREGDGVIISVIPVGAEDPVAFESIFDVTDTWSHTFTEELPDGMYEIHLRTIDGDSGFLSETEVVIPITVVPPTPGNTGSVSLDREEYPVPFGGLDDFGGVIPGTTPGDRSIFPVHATAITTNGALDSIDDDETLGIRDLQIHVQVDDPDFDISPTTVDQIGVDDGTGVGPVKITVTRGGNTIVLATAGGPVSSGGDTVITIGDDLSPSTRELGPILEIGPDTGIFELDLAIRYTDGPADTQCPPTTTFTPLDGSGGTAETTRFDTPSPPGADYCILTGDLLVVEYIDPAGDDGQPSMTIVDAPFSLQTGVLQTDKGVYIVGDDAILTLIEPDLNLENEESEIYDLDLIEWDSDAADVTLGDLGGQTGAFNPDPADFRETGDSTGIFQIVIEIPESLKGDRLEQGEEITLEYTDWGPSGSDFVGKGDEDVNVTLFTANFGVAIELDQKVYSWTEKAFITITAPDQNFDPSLVDEIGDSDLDPIKISTRGHDLENYRLVETDTDTGIFVGEVILTGFLHDADGDPTTGDANGFDTNPKTQGNGPTDGFIETEDKDDLTISFSLPGITVVDTAEIKWNIGEVEWLEASYPATGTGVVRVVDPDMNLDPEAVDNFKVNVWSDSDAGGIDLTVIETNEATGIFEGPVIFTPTDPTSGDTLRVNFGDTITGEYGDNTLPDPFAPGDTKDVIGTTIIFLSPPPNEPPTIEITSPVVIFAFLSGDTVTFTGTAEDAEGESLDSKIEWKIGGVDFGLGPEIMTDLLAVGEHTVTASVTDSDGQTAETSITITIFDLPTILSPSEFDVSIAEGETVEFPIIITADVSVPLVVDVTGTNCDALDHAIDGQPLPDVIFSGLGETSYSFTIDYTDVGGIDVSTIDTCDVTVTGASGPIAGSPITGTYNVNPPPPPGVIEIDILPNKINPNKGKIPVAILGSDTFDVNDVDVSTLKFGPDGAEPDKGKIKFEDVNGDGFIDGVVEFKTKDTGIESGFIGACLSGDLNDGTAIFACDDITTVPDKDKGRGKGKSKVQTVELIGILTCTGDSTHGDIFVFDHDIGQFVNFGECNGNETVTIDVTIELPKKVKELEIKIECFSDDGENESTDKIKLKKKKPVESSDICPINEIDSVIDDLQGIVVHA